MCSWFDIRQSVLFKIKKSLPLSNLDIIKQLIIKNVEKKYGQNLNQLNFLKIAIDLINLFINIE